MTFKHNNGNGAVICNRCSKIISYGTLSYEEYAIYWRDKPNLCMACKDATTNETDEQENGNGSNVSDNERKAG